MLNHSSQLPDADLKYLLDAYRKDILLDFNCHAIAKIVSFDSVKQTVNATIVYKKTNVEYEPISKVKRLVNVDYPILVDCPVVILGGGTSHLTFPISPGDTCLILFNDRDLDNWFKGSTGSPVNTPRLHNFSDGIALVGLNNLASTILNYDTTHALLKNGVAGVGVSSTKIKIYNSITDLKKVLDDLITAVNLLTTATNTLVSQTSSITVPVTCAAPGVTVTSAAPTNAAAINAVASTLGTVGTRLTAVSVKIAGLLE